MLSDACDSCTRLYAGHYVYCELLIQKVCGPSEKYETLVLYKQGKFQSLHEMNFIAVPGEFISYIFHQP